MSIGLFSNINIKDVDKIKFKYIATLKKGKLPNKKENGNLLPYLSMEFLRSDSANAEYVSSENMIIAEDGDIVLLWDGSNAGSFFLAKKGVVSSTLALVSKYNRDADQKYFYWHLKAYEPIVKKYTIGMGIPHVDGTFLNNIKLLIPLKIKQKKIAEFLDKETARIDALIEEKQKMLDLLEEKRTALISHIVTCGIDPNVEMKPSGVEWIGEVPKDWQLMQLKRVWESAEYGISKSIKDEGDIRVLRMNSITKDGRIDILKSGKIDINEISSDLLLKKDDILFNRTNSLDQIAKVGMVDFEPKEPLTFASYLVRIRVNENVLPKYLVYLLNSSIFIKYARKNAIPAIGQANLNPTRYGEIHIVIPDTYEQKNIVEYLEKFDLKNSELQNELSKSIKLLQERRTALITAAVTGAT